MSWELLDLDGALVASGSGFSNDNSTNVCLDEGSSLHNDHDGLIWRWLEWWFLHNSFRLNDLAQVV